MNHLQNHPNIKLHHIHFIIINVGADLRVCPNDTGEPMNTGEHTGSPLPRVVQWYKTMTTNMYIRGVKNHAWQRFSQVLWQRNYYEHIIRDDEDFNRIQEYIKTNPTLWYKDSLNPNKKDWQ